MKADKAPIAILSEYADFANIFSTNLAAKFLKYIGINDHAINLVDRQQPVYGPIHTLGPIELETLKTYIKTNLVKGFIKLFKLLISAFILCVWKPDGSFWLCDNYQKLNNFIIKNRYLLLLIG